MRYLLVASLLLGSATSAHAQVQVSIGVGVPVVDIGIRVPVYPQLVQVPGYPVYYDPRGASNYFFYDGAYWVFQGDTWYVSSWYDGPWQMVEPDYVPLYVLRVPVRYYRTPPGYFRGWRHDRPPRWGDRWGRDWEHRRAGWDRWDRRRVPRAAPLPVYQRQYAGPRYPRAPEQQHAIRSERYRYRAHEPVTRERFERRGGHDDRGHDRYDGPRGDPRHDRGYDGPRGDPRHDRYDGPRGGDRRHDDRGHEGARGGPRQDDRGHAGPRGDARQDRGHDGPRGGPRPDDRGHDGARGGPRQDDRGHDGQRGDPRRDRGRDDNDWNHGRR